VDGETIRRAVEAERRDLADLLDRLAPADWDGASLCTGWTVRDVVAHLTLATRLSREARGPGGELLLVLTGRGAGLDGLDGPTAGEVAARLRA